MAACTRTSGSERKQRRNPLHVHGLLANVPPQAVHEWKIGEKGCPHSAKAIVMNGRKAAEIPAYSRKYGYNLLESITDLRKLLRYLLKSLDRAQEYRQKGQHLYYAQCWTPAEIESRAVYAGYAG